MAFTRPTLQQLIARIQQDFVSELEIDGPILRRSMAYVLSRVLGGAAHLFHGHLAYLLGQIFPDSADPKYLLRFAALFGQAPVAAGFAKRTVTVTGTNGTAIPAGTVLVHASGATFVTDADATIVGGAVVVAVTATLAGTAANAAGAGSLLDFESPISGASSPATVAIGGVDGVDQEGIEVFRARFLAYLRDPPHGGSSSDYEEWALQVAGVTRVWVYPQELGAGTVTIRFVRDGDPLTPIPDSAEVAVVQAYLDSKRPVTATPIVLAPVADTVNYNLSVLPDTVAVQDLVTAELADLHAHAIPGGTIPASAIQSAIGRAYGITDFTVNSPVGAVVSATGHLAQLGSITFV